MNELAKEIEFNAKAEAQAVYDYTELLGKIAESGLNENEKGGITDIINEIIADELNHQNRLQEVYTYLTGIEPNKN